MFNGLLNLLARRDVCRVLIGLVLMDLGGCFAFSDRTHTPIGLGCVGTAAGLSARGATCFHPHRGILARSAAGTTVVDECSDAGVALRANAGGSLAAIGEGWVTHRTSSIGLLAPVYRRYSHTLYLNDYGMPLTPAEVAAFRVGYAALMPAWGMTGDAEFDWPARVASGDGETWVLQPAAAAHDLLAVVALLLACCSLMLQEDRLATLVGSGFSRQEARIRAGQCPGCGYDMTGLGGKCPECGAGSDPPTAEQERGENCSQHRDGHDQPEDQPPAHDRPEH